MRKILLAAAFGMLSALSAFGQSSLTPTYKAITLTGGGSSGDVSGMSVTASGTTHTLGQWFIANTSMQGAAQGGDVLGVWPNLYFAPNPRFQGTPTVDGAAASHFEFIRGGSQYTFVGADATQIGISSSEALPIVLSNNGYTHRIYVDPSAGNVGIGTDAPAARLDVASQSIIVEQSYTPVSSSASCTQGQISWDSGFVYVCVSTGQWKRAALSSW